MTQVIGTSPLQALGTPTMGGGVVSRRAAKKRGNDAGKLNLVSLMDIFTILVFFLMLNSGDVEVLQADENIVLPKSTATLKPDDVPVIKITAEQILFRDLPVASLQKLQAGESIPALEVALSEYSSSKVASAKSSQADTGTNEARGVSIMSDANTSYAVLKRVLYASAQAGYRDIGLATELSGGTEVNGRGLAINE